MTIEIINIIPIEGVEGSPNTRTAIIAIDNTYEWAVGGLPLSGDLQPILDVDEAKYLAAAQAANRLLDVFGVEIKELFRAYTEVLIDELNNQANTTNAILDAIDNATSLAEVKAAVAAIPNLPLRDISQVRGAIKNELVNSP